MPEEHEILDWTNAPFGCLVVYSDHYIKQHGGKKNDKIGVVTNLSFHLDSKERVIAWPDIYWEGAVMSSMTHPMNVKPYRKEIQLAKTTMDDGQPPTCENYPKCGHRPYTCHRQPAPVYGTTDDYLSYN